ncbi:MAG: C2 family cysteine protease [Polyangiaceae bacterium]
MRAVGTRRPGSSLRDTRGGALVEYVIVVGTIAVFAVAAAGRLGGVVEAKVRCYASLVAGSEGCPGHGLAEPAAPAPSVDAPPAAGTGSSNPSLEHWGGTHTPIPGTPFVQGPGDPAPVHGSDVTQGSMADCYLLSPLGALAMQDPSSIEELIRDNGDGTYTITFREPNPHDWWAFWEPPYREHPVVVTPEFATSEGEPTFAKPGDRSADGAELWVMLIEKGYAQHRGGYDAIGNSGPPQEALEALTGQESIFLQSRYDSLARVVEELAAGHALVSSSLGAEEARANPLFTEGVRGNPPLVASHAYYVTAADPVSGTITLQNPHGWDDEGITLTWDEYVSAFPWTTYNPIDA